MHLSLTINAVFVVVCGLLAWYNWGKHSYKLSNFLNMTAVVINTFIIVMHILHGALHG